MSRAVIEVIKPQPVLDELTIQNLRETIARIESGEIIAAAVVEIHRNGNTDSYYGGKSYPAIVGCLQRLQHRMMLQWDESSQKSL